MIADDLSDEGVFYISLSSWDAKNARFCFFSFAQAVA
jgi:hypothetical protein